MRQTATRLYALVMFVVVSVLCGVLTAGLVVPAAAIAGGTAKIGADSLENLPTTLTEVPQMERSRVLLGDGRELAQFYDQNRVYVSLENISPLMQQAQVAIEDHRFFEHGAIDPQGTLRAFVRNSTGGSTQGGSTLTQQYVKQALIQAAEAAGDQAGIQRAQEETISRKVRELRYAIGLEKQLSKEQVLERYLNIAYYGDGAYGVQAAAKHYFNTDAASLTLAQAAMLAGLVQNPDATNPRLHPQAATDRRNVVLNRMQELSTMGELWGPALASSQVAEAKKVPFDPTKIVASPNGCFTSQFPFICDFVKRTLLTMPALGATVQDRENTLNRGGLTIKTLINAEAQKKAEDAIHTVVAASDPVDSGTVIIRPKDGLIVAMAQNRTDMGAKIPAETYYNYSVEGAMGGAEGYQAGSTFKMFTIAAAIEKGYTPNKRYEAPKVYTPYGQTFSNCDGSYVFQDKGYKVTNSVGGYDNRQITMVQAAQGSVNTYFMQMFRDVGGCNVVKMAEKLGVKVADPDDQLEDHDYPSFTLGTPYVTPLSMAVAYATIANHGKRCEPRIVESVVDSAGTNIEVPGPTCKQVVPAKVADGTAFVLSQVMTGRGTGTRARIPGFQNQAGKTGTTESNKAVWFAGFTPEMAGIAYVGMNTNDKVGGAYWGKRRGSLKGWCPPSGSRCLEGSGSGDAGRIYKVAMQYALKGLPDTPFTAPPDDVLRGKILTVPSVRGMDAATAQKVLQEAGFSTGKSFSRCGNYPKGTYMRYTSPYEGARVSQDTVINLVYSSGPCVVKTQKPKTPSPTATGGSGGDSGGGGGGTTKPNPQPPTTTPKR